MFAIRNMWGIKIHDFPLVIRRMSRMIQSRIRRNAHIRTRTGSLPVHNPWHHVIHDDLDWPSKVTSTSGNL